MSDCDRSVRPAAGFAPPFQDNFQDNLPTGVFVATGLSAGICSTVEAAQQEVRHTSEQVDQVLNRAVRVWAASAGDAETAEEKVGSADECAAVMARLREGQ